MRPAFLYYQYSSNRLIVTTFKYVLFTRSSKQEPQPVPSALRASLRPSRGDRVAGRPNRRSRPEAGELLDDGMIVAARRREFATP